jgi:hypothetical protein
MKVDLYKQMSFTTPINASVFGVSGVGKSSFINTALTFASEGVIKKAKVRTKQDKQMTVTYDKYEMNEFVNLFDIWGWSSELKNLEKNDFYKMVVGKFEVNQHMSISNNSNTVNKSNKLDVIFFVVDPGVLDGEYLKDMKEYYDIANKSKILSS